MKANPSRKSDTADFEKALAQTGAGRYVLTLYVTGTSRRSIQSIEAIKSLCEQHLPGRYDLEVVDLYQQPRKAKDDQIFAAPTGTTRSSSPQTRVVGARMPPSRCSSVTLRI